MLLNFRFKIYLSIIYVFKYIFYGNIDAVVIVCQIYEIELKK
jgi:hypothetical protein